MFLNMKDVISRKEVVNKISKEYEESEHTKSLHERTGMLDSISTVKSVEPIMKWTLCSEEMPKEREWVGTKSFGTTISDTVYVTFEAPDGDRFVKYLAFQNGKLSSSDQQMIDVIFHGAKPVAWMPFIIPYPYEG